MLKNISLTLKLPLLIVSLLLLMSGTIGVSTYWTARDDLFNAIAKRSEAIAESRDNQLEIYFNTLRSDAIALSESPAAMHLQPALEAMLRLKHYDDILIMDANGQITESASQDPDTENIGEIFQKTSHLQHGEVFFSDMLNDADGNQGFILAAPIYADGVVKGAIMLRISATTLNMIMMDQTGMSTGAHIFLLGPDKFYRADVSGKASHQIMAGRQDGAIVDAALHGEKGDGYLMVDDALHYGRYMPLMVFGTRWALVAVEEVSEVMAPVTNLRDDILWQMLAFAVIGIFLSLLIAAMVTHPIRRLHRAMNRLAEAHYDTDVPVTDYKDEIGAMAKAVAVLKQKGLETLALKQERKETLLRLAGEFDSSVGHIMQNVTKNVTDLRGLADGMSGLAQRASTQSQNVAVNAQNVSTNVQTVAAAAQELTAAIREISQQVTHSSGIAKQGTAKAQKTGIIVHDLAKSATSVGDIIKIINTIAEQTNLLALNATIEAARAGDAGRGFAVVASEVKSLAAQTTKATADITLQIQSMQQTTQETVGAVDSLRQAIVTMDEISTSIAAAIEEQSAATNEIARNVHEASLATNAVSSHIADVQKVSAETGQAAGQVVNAATKLSDQITGSLTQQVEGFLKTIQEA